MMKLARQRRIPFAQKARLQRKDGLFENHKCKMRFVYRFIYRMNRSCSV